MAFRGQSYIQVRGSSMRQTVVAWTHCGDTQRGRILTPEAYLGVRQVGWEQSVLPENHTQQTRTTKELVSLETSYPIRNGTCLFKCLGIKSHRSFKKKKKLLPRYLSLEFRQGGVAQEITISVFQIIVIHTWSLFENQISNSDVFSP